LIVRGWHTDIMRRREINANYTVVAPAMVMMVLMKKRPEMVKRDWFSIGTKSLSNR
jgi:hypothetical protein